jgi:hypothetical protein
VGNARRAGLTRPAAGTAFSCRDAQRGDLPLHYAFTPLTKDLINVPNMFKQKTSLEDLSLHMPNVFPFPRGRHKKQRSSKGDGTVHLPARATLPVFRVVDPQLPLCLLTP